MQGPNYNWLNFFKLSNETLLKNLLLIFSFVFAKQTKKSFDFVKNHFSSFQIRIKPKILIIFSQQILGGICLFVFSVEKVTPLSISFLYRENWFANTFYAKNRICNDYIAAVDILQAFFLNSSVKGNTMNQHCPR